MLWIRKILLRGSSVEDACVEFDSGANILAGESDTGKSFLISCLDYIFGAERLKKHLKEAAAYTHLFVEFENSDKKVLTLERALAGGSLLAHNVQIDDIREKGEVIAPVRKGKSRGPDVTSVLFPFAQIKEARLRKNARGETQRCSIRTLAPLFLVDEVSIIDEHSPVTGRPSYDDTARKRMFSYLLTGIDDDGIAAAEKDEIVKARLQAKLEVVQELIRPLEERFGTIADSVPIAHSPDDELDDVIVSLTEEVEAATAAISRLHQDAQTATALTLRAESQLLGVAEIQSRYELLGERYRSDLKRLDFLAEGSHYFDSLQEVPCPLCEQNIAPPHLHSEGGHALISGHEIRRSAAAEAAKIHAYLADLQKAMGSVEQRKDELEQEKSEAYATLSILQEDLTRNLTPQLANTAGHLESLLEHRAERDAERSEFRRWTDLRALQRNLQESLADSAQPKLEWGGLSSLSLGQLCTEIEAVLTEWKWSSSPRVFFDEEEYDIVVDGQPRQSHGKGVRAVLYSAFIIGLIRYCANNGKPHPGVVVIDSPLTSYKKKGAAAVSGADGPVSAGVEEGFWHSLNRLPKTLQIIVIENKEPPASVAEEVHYEWFAGENAEVEERAALIPPPGRF
ncbi:MAG TPA: hypothetical protein VJ673_19415 [Aromatoleum sp.]|uniref:hypothetical protein n=1 Tax=Aromatoleum sp. TaxID=2307007 RepID=UPI002B4645D5|nr:hypothetical protein [Aromatoleum sp.]HJV27859.1 hypothetical protein [Aromatoleum sp.]